MAFTASHLGDVVLRQGEMWANPRSERRLIKDVTAKTLMGNQQVRFDPVLTGNRCIGVKTHWLTLCAASTLVGFGSGSDISTCDISGNPIESESKTYTPNFWAKDSFIVWDDECKDAYTTVEKTAKAMLEKKLGIENKLNEFLVAQLEANLMANAFLTADSEQGGTYTSGTKTFSYPAAKWVPDLMAELAVMANRNLITNPLYLHGTNLFQLNWNAGFNSLNDNQRDQLAKLSALNHYWDMPTIDPISGTKTTYIIDPGGYGFFCKNEFTNTAPERRADDTYTWVENSNNYSYLDGGVSTPLKYDITMKEKCTTTTVSGRVVRRWGKVYEIALAGGFIFNPMGCGKTDDTGILKLTKV